MTGRGLGAAIAGRTDVVIRLSASGSVDGTLDGFTDIPQVIALPADDVSSTAYHATSSARAFHLRDIPAGAYRIVASSPSGVAFGSVTVPAGSTAKVALHGQGYGAITVTVVD